MQGQGSAPASSQNLADVTGNPACVWKYCCALRCEQCMALAGGLLESYTLTCIECVMYSYTPMWDAFILLYLFSALAAVTF